MRRFSIASVFVVLAVFAMIAAAASCRRGAGSATPGRRVIVLGFDGLDYQLTRTLMEAGRLPNFSRLAKMGGFSALATSMPPQSPVAWSTFTTGLDPAGHGIYDFIHRDPETMTPYLSTTRTESAEWTLPVGPWQFPLKGGRVTSLRGGEPFWARLEAAGARTSILRMPANYPPSGQAEHELSGMGTPDILGTYGTFSFYTSEPFAYAGRTIAGGTIHRVRVIGDRLDAALDGPDNPFRRERVKLTAPFIAYIDAREPAARIMIGSEQRVLAVGEWSDWVPVAFELTPMQSLRGMCRFYLKQVRPYLELYVTPINLDPTSPALPISTPSSYAAELAAATGRFYTQGMPEDTKAYSAGVFNAEEFLRQARLTADESRRQYAYALDRFVGGTNAAGSTSSGSDARLLFYYFGHVDQVSHMMWRAMDPGHPAYDAATDAPHAHVVEDLYVGLDRIVGETLDRMTPDMLLVIMSDHGFTSWRRTFHLNTWLEQNGYLTVRDPSRRAQAMFANVDWSKTRAYGLGLNGLYLNLQGREKNGIVTAAQREALTRGDRGEAAGDARSVDGAARDHRDRADERRGRTRAGGASGARARFAGRLCEGHARIERIGARRSASRGDDRQQGSVERRSLHGSRGRAGRVVRQPAAAAQGRIAAGSDGRDPRGVWDSEVAASRRTRE